MNIDAVIIANHLWRMPDEVCEALNRGIAGASGQDALTLATFLNKFPRHVLSAMQRILEIEV